MQYVSNRDTFQKVEEMRAVSGITLKCDNGSGAAYECFSYLFILFLFFVFLFFSSVCFFPSISLDRYIFDLSFILQKYDDPFY